MLRSVAALAAALLLAAPAWAGSPITLSCTATTDCASAFAAASHGFFARHGLDVKITPIALNSNIPAALMSDSIQIGGPTPSVFLQAVDGGLDLVALATASVTSKETVDGAAAVARTGSGIDKPADFAGHRVGVPGIGAFLDVLFRQSLIQHGIDPGKITFVEVTFPTMSDALKGGAVDGVVSANPFLARILAAGTGKVVSNFLADVPDGEPQILYASTRAWAGAHQPEVAAFRAAIAEGADFVRANPDAAREDVAKFTKLPIAVLKTMKLSWSSAAIDKAQLDWWVGVMRGQKMLQSTPDTAALIPAP
ncbi:MAG: ABC transporter substrate-binding protein [Rhodospirillales bacterium]|nr:ABC transporter substrate-binding protein [Rhodospirillales bacterium]